MSVLVSIVMPVYNPDSELFNLAITSILQQGYAPIELIISDDSNNDLVGEILKGYKDNRIQYYKNSGHKGIFPNLNNAIKQASGYFIQIFCQDDLMMAGCISDQVQLMAQYPEAGMGFCNYFTSFPNEDEVAQDTRTMLLPAQYFINSMFLHGCLPGNLSPVILKRECIDKLGYFDEHFKYCGDHEYWIRFAKEFNACYSYKKSMVVRTHDKQASSTLPFAIKVEETIKNYQELIRINTIRETRFRKWLYINEKWGVQFFKIIIKNIVKGRVNYFKTLKNLQNDVFNLPLIALLSVVTLGNKLKWIKIKETKI